MEHEVELLHELLYGVEKLENLIIAHEVININKYKIQNEVHIIRQSIRLNTLNPFIFFTNKY